MKALLVAAAIALAVPGLAMAQNNGSSPPAGTSTNGTRPGGNTPGTVGRETTGGNPMMPRTQSGQTGSAEETGSGAHGAGGGGPQPVQ